MATRLRWLRWLATWLALIVIIALLTGAVVGSFLSPPLVWSSALVLGSALALLLAPSPLGDGE